MLSSQKAKRVLLVLLAALASVVAVLLCAAAVFAWQEMTHEGLTSSQWYQGAIESFSLAWLYAVLAVQAAVMLWYGAARTAAKKPRGPGARPAVLWLGADRPDGAAGRLRTPALACAGTGRGQRVCLRRGGGVWQGAKRMGACGGCVRAGLAEMAEAARAGREKEGEQDGKRDENDDPSWKCGAAYSQGHDLRLVWPCQPGP